MPQPGTTQPVTDLWNSYHAAVLPADAGPAQVVECRRAFFAGAKAVLDVVMEPSTSEEAFAAMMETIYTEFASFARMVQEGRA